MLMTSQFPVETANIFYSLFDMHLCPPTLKKVPPPMDTVRFTQSQSMQKWFVKMYCSTIITIKSHHSVYTFISYKFYTSIR